MLEKAILHIDKKNSEDPVKVIIDGNEIAGEILYAQRMTHWLFELDKNPSGELQVAVRANHIARWESPRNNYPMDRPGYFKWREDLILHHQKTVKLILEELGSEILFIERVLQIMSKQMIKKDAESQMYEDTICLVFLEHYLAKFYLSSEVEEQKMISILRKTWPKMSKNGQDKALTLDLPEASQILVKKALRL